MPTDINRASEPKPRKRKRFSAPAAIGRMIAIVIMIGIISGCIVASVLTVYVLNTLDQGDSVVLENVKLGFSTIIYAKDPTTGEDVELQRVQTSENRIWIDYDKIPQSLKDAAVAVEDMRFWQHSGIDMKRTFAAALNMFNPFSDDGLFGGSTITQQVVKNVTGDKDPRVDRKMREIFRAINLEKNYSKEQILEVYLNTIALGKGQLGVQSAANLYFGKNADELTPAESASLIAITQNPSKWDPFVYPENNRKRQLMILEMMHKQKRRDGVPMLSDTEYQDAISQPMVFQKEQYTEKLESVQNWFIDTVYEEVLDDLVHVAGYTESGASDALRSGGFRIYTTVDTEMQDYLEKKYTDPKTFPTIRNPEYPQSAFVILDPKDGAIKAIVGSNREKDGARLFNRATDAERQPGSTIKPLAAYAPALEYDFIHWSMIWEDSPILLNENDPKSTYPNNFYGYYKGPITITEAIQRSTNTIPVKLVKTMLSPRTSFNFLRDSLGFSHLVESKTINGRVYSDVDIAPMALGAMTGGVTPVEMAAGYQMFANGGYYNKPHAYTKVIDSNGNVILENRSVPKRVISPETATIMNKLLQRVTAAAPGTGTPAKFSAMPIAGKTGTSEDDQNQWFIGVTPYYVGVCWLGYDIPERINYSGYSYPPPLIWKNVMAPIHANLPIIEFPTLGNVVQHEYCLESGNLAGALCTQKAMGWYKLSNTPKVCDLHDRPVVDESSSTASDTPGGEAVDPTDELAYWRWLYGVDGEENTD